MKCAQENLRQLATILSLEEFTRRDLRLHIRYSSGMPSRTMIGGIVLNWLRHIPAALCDSLGEPHQEESSYEPALPPQSIFLRQLCSNLV